MARIFDINFSKFNPWKLLYYDGPFMSGNNIVVISPKISWDDASIYFLWNSYEK